MPERGLFGLRHRRNFYEQVLLAPQPDYAIVLQIAGTSGDSADDYRTLEHISFDEWKQSAEGASRYFKVDLGESTLVEQLDVTSKNGDSEFTVNVVASVVVSEPAVVVCSLSMRPLGTVSAAIRDVATRVGEAHRIQDAHLVAETIKTELTRSSVVSGVAVRRCYVLVEPDSGSTERAKALHAQQLENELRDMKAKHEAALFDQQKAYEQEKLDRQNALETGRLEHAAELEELQHSLDTARTEHRKLLDETKQAHEANMADDKSAREREAAKRINDDIAQNPDNVIGYLLSLEDNKPVHEAIKLIDDRERARWDRLKEVGKLDIFKNDAYLRMRVLRDLGYDEHGDDQD